MKQTLVWSLVDQKELYFNICFNTIACLPCNILNPFEFIDNEDCDQYVPRTSYVYYEYNYKRNMEIGYEYENEYQHHENMMRCVNMNHITHPISICKDVVHHRTCHAAGDLYRRKFWCNDDYGVRLLKNKIYIWKIFLDHIEFLYKIPAKNMEYLLYVDNTKIIGYCEREILVVDFACTEETRASIKKSTCHCVLS